MTGAEQAFADGIADADSRGWLRTDLDRRELVATFWLLDSAETWTRLTGDAGLDDDSYRRWLRRSMLEQLRRRHPSAHPGRWRQQAPTSSVAQIHERNREDATLENSARTASPRIC